MLFSYKSEQPWFSALNAVRLKAQALMAYSYGFSIRNHTIMSGYGHVYMNIKLLSTCFLFKHTKFASIERILLGTKLVHRAF